MDTTFWGPSGHLLFHTLTREYDQSYDKNNNHRLLCRFFKSVGHILPCIYCRRSFQLYYRQVPLKPFAKRGHTFRWYYHIHNLINDKLRKQGYLHSPNPSYQSVERKYKKRRTCFVGWNFLYSVVYHYPSHISELSARRQKAYRDFFTLLAEFYPVQSYRRSYDAYLLTHPVDDALVGSVPLLKWFYGFERRVNPRCCTLRSRCSKLEKYAVKKCVNKSCRK